MASAVCKPFFSLFLSFVLFISGVLGRIVCEQLDRRTCAYAVSSSSLRCVLEKRVRGKGREAVYTCQTSGVKAYVGVYGWIESDECVEACGLDRDTLGISSDNLIDRQFMRRLCLPKCFEGCPNVIDLYKNLAAGEEMLRGKCATPQRAYGRVTDLGFQWSHGPDRPGYRFRD